MKFKIAVIATEFLNDFIHTSLRKLTEESSGEALDFSYDIFLYHTFEEMQEIGTKIGGQFDGILTSGSFPARMLQIYHPEERRPVAFFNTDEAALYRLFLSLLAKNRELDFHRIYADILEVFGVKTVDFLEERCAMPDSSVLPEDEFSLERLLQIEREQYEMHLSLWKSGKTDVSVSRFSSIIPPLKAAGVNICFPYPSERYLRDVCEKLLHEIERRKLEAMKPAVVILRLPFEPEKEGFSRREELGYLRLEQLVLEFISASVLNYSVQRRHYGLEIMMTGRDFSEWTENFQRDRLRTFLETKQDCGKLCIGYGLGDSLSQARFHALDACRESELKQFASYLIDAREQLIGPLSGGQSSVPLPLSANAKEISGIQSSLSELTLRKIFAALDASEDHAITARELALRLGITKRSANRFLSTLLKEGTLAVSHKTRATTKGRPESVFVKAV